MAMVTPETTKLELRRDEKNRFRLYFDGVLIPGVMETVMSQETPNRPIFTITVHGNAVRVVENETVIANCDGDA